MEEDKTLFDEEESYAYDASDKPFDFVEVGIGTALVCESDPVAREKISSALKDMGYQITEPASIKDAVKNMRFHIYDVIILNENFDTENPDTNIVLNSIANLNIGTRRQIFVALLSSRFRTMDNMTAFNKSVNVIVNMKNIDDINTILKRSLTDNTAFYHLFKEALKKKGRI
jgi:CheY-like chemotaxis protein